jgi:hypothetical protein
MHVGIDVDDKANILGIDVVYKASIYSGGGRSSLENYQEPSLENCQEADLSGELPGGRSSLQNCKEQGKGGNKKKVASSLDTFFGGYWTKACQV